MHSLSVDQKSEVLQQTADALVRRKGPELTTRELGVFLTCYLMDDVQTVRDLCWKLDASKPAIAGALDRLSELDLVRRTADPMDRRSILIQRTAAGTTLLVSIKNISVDAIKSARERTTLVAGYDHRTTNLSGR